MPDALPFRQYLESRDALARGDREEAARLLEEALGADTPNDYVRMVMDRLLDHRSMAGEAALEVLRGQMMRRKRG